MFDALRSGFDDATSRFRFWRLRTKGRFARYLRAWHYATQSISSDDAQHIMVECRDAAGWYPLLVLSVEETLEQARECFMDHPDLPRIIADGCARVGDKWESYGDELYEARRWAIHAAEEYAADEGITLVHRDGPAEGDLKSEG